MNISTLGQTAAQAAQVTTAAENTLGKDDFLRLLTVQLQYQDPLEPLKNTEFIAQMAQFSSLEQLQNMNQALTQNLSAETQLRDAFSNNLATALIGKTVEVPTYEIEYDGQNESALSYRLGTGANKAQLQILDARGQLVRELELDSSSSYGTATWDGRSEDGSEVPPGAYIAAIRAQDATGTEVSGDALRQVRVDAVRYGEDGARILAGGVELALEDLSGVAGVEP